MRNYGRVENVALLRGRIGEAGEIFKSVLEANSGCVTARLPDEVQIAFVVSGPKGGAWVLNLCERVEVRPGTTAWPDCRLECDDVTFLKIVGGELSSRDAFLKGVVRIQGDVGLLLALEEAVMNPTVRTGPV